MKNLRKKKQDFRDYKKEKHLKFFLSMIRKNKLNLNSNLYLIYSIKNDNNNNNNNIRILEKKEKKNEHLRDIIYLYIIKVVFTLI